MALQSQISNMLDCITCTTVPCDIHQWYNDILSSVEHGSKQPRSADIKVPDASSNYEDFISIWMNKIHTNGYAWSWVLLWEGKKGKIHVLFSVQTRSSYMEHLSPSDYTIQIGKHCKKTTCKYLSLSHGWRYTIAMLNAPNNALIGQFIHQHPMGPIIWEQTWYE